MTRDLRDRCANPSAFYDQAADVLADETLTPSEKEYLLKSMALRADHLEDPGSGREATGEHPADLTAIHRALNQLGELHSLDGRAADDVDSATRVFSRIVAALAGDNDLDRAVVEMTDGIARLSRGEVTFVSAVPPDRGGVNAGAVAPLSGVVIPPSESVTELEARMEERRERLRETLSRTSATPVTYHIEVRPGFIEDEVLRTADERSADLIIVGSHDRSWFEGLFSPKIAQQVANSSHCPVLIVPE